MKEIPSTGRTTLPNLMICSTDDRTDVHGDGLRNSKAASECQRCRAIWAHVACTGAIWQSSSSCNLLLHPTGMRMGKKSGAE